MSIKKLLLTAAAAAVLVSTGAAARDFDRGFDRDGRPGHAMVLQHDRYWHNGYRGFVGRDVVFNGLRAHHFVRWAGDPYWFHGRYVVRTYDRFGHVVLVEMNPYTGGFIGTVRF